MKKLFLLLLTALCILEAAGKNLLVLVAEGKAKGQIVLPEKPPIPGRFYREFADMFNEAVFHSTGVKLPVVAFSAQKKGLTPFFIGTVPPHAAAPAAGEYKIECTPRGIWCYGCDRSWNRHSSPMNHWDYMLGSGAAVAAFSQKFLDCYYTLPGQKIPAVKKMEKLAVPANFSKQYRPFFKYNFSHSRSGGIPYDLHNGRFSYPWFKNYGGHSHNAAVRRNKYKQSHPEYFAMHRGKRLHPRLYGTQYCLSNPHVQKLILAEVIKQMDSGFQTVQLAQADGFHWCECKQCALLYGKVSFREKLWLLHRDIAAKAAVLRPGKKVAILSYGPTENPPETFDSFPSNVIIDLAPGSREQILKWQKMKVPGGYSAYIYNWGIYHSAGFTPKMSFEDLQKQLELFRRYGIRGIYTCGFGELPGLEGAAYFIWNRLQLEPEAKIRDLLKLYCQKSYGPGAAAAEKFYTLIDRQLKKFPHLLEAFDQPGQIRRETPSSLLMKRYPPRIIRELEQLLSAIEEKSGKITAVKILKIELACLKHTMAVISAYNTFFHDRSDAHCRKILNALEAREKFILSIPNNGRYFDKVDGIPVFTNTSVRQLLDGGRLYGKIPTPFSWDYQWMRQNNIKPAGRKIAPDGKKQYLFQQGLHTFDPVIRQKPTQVSCLYDKNNLYVTFEGSREKRNDFANNGFHVYLFRQNGTGYRVICGLSPQLKHWSYLSTRTGKETFKKVSSPAFKAALDAGKALLTITVPWQIVGGLPRKGEKIGFNTVRVNKNTALTYVWEQTQHQIKYEMRLNEYGTLTTESPEYTL